MVSPQEPSERDHLLTTTTTTDNVVKKHAADPKDIRPGDLEGSHLYLALAFPYIGLLLCAIDVTMTSTVSATIASEFDSLSIVSWLGSAYLVAAAPIKPISGKFTDLFGRRAGFFVALACFCLGNLMCGYAQTTATLVAGRVVAGTGGGAMSIICTFITSDLVPLRGRSMWQGLSSVLWAVGMGLGGVVGGVVNDLVGWRWAFIGLTPFTLLVAVGAYFTLLPGPYNLEYSKDTSKPIDYAGAATLTGSLVLLIIGLNNAKESSNQLWSLVPLIISAVLIICFIVIEVWVAADPIVPVHLLADRSVAAACVSGLLVSGSLQSLLFYVPLGIQVRGFSTSEVGLQLLGEPLGASIGSFATGLAIRVLGGYGVVKPVGFLVFLAAPVAFTFSNLDTPTWITVISLAAMGAGFGSVLTTVVIALLAITEQAVQATCTGMQSAFRQVGASGGLALAGLIFRAKVHRDLASSEKSHYNDNNHYYYSTAENFTVQKALDNIAKECSRHRRVGGDWPAPCVSYSNGLYYVFLFSAILGAAGFICGLLIRNASLDRDDRKRTSTTTEEEGSVQEEDA